jgi:hypothetical protein
VDEVGAHVAQPSENTDGTMELHYAVSAKQCSTYGAKPPPELSTQPQPRRLHGGYHRGILGHDHRGFSPMVSPLNPVAAPTVAYEYP